MNTMFSAMLAAATAKKPYKRRVSYLESTGTQYIDTGIAATEATRITANFESIVSGSTLFAFFGARASNYSDACCFFRVNNNFRADFGSEMISGVPVADYADVALDATKAMINGVDYALGSVGVFTSPSSILLFSIHTGTTTDARMAQCRCTAFTVSNGNTLVRDFIPVIDWNDTPCMYDKVSKALFYNQGAGQFNYA